MWPFGKTKRHLRYDSISDWIVGENVPERFVYHPDPNQRDRYIAQYGELRQHLFDKHIKTLSRADQELLEQGCHPSQSHDLSAEAECYVDKLHMRLQELGCHAIDIRLGFYHCDRIILSVVLADSDAAKIESLPWLFAGFEIKYLADASSKSNSPPHAPERS